MFPDSLINELGLKINICNYKYKYQDIFEILIKSLSNRFLKYYIDKII